MIAMMTKRKGERRMNDAAEWIALCYSVPASPSKARVFVWRRLRALGAVTLRPGLAALPNTPRGVREFTSLAGRITELGGESLLLTMDLVDAGEGERLRERFAAEDRRAWQKALDQAAPLLEALRTAPPAERAQLERDLGRRLGRLRGENPLLGQLGELEQTAGSLFEVLRSLPGEFSAMLRGTEPTGRQREPKDHHDNNSGGHR